MRENLLPTSASPSGDVTQTPGCAPTAAENLRAMRFHGGPVGKREKIEGTRRTSGRRWDPVVIFRQRRAVFTFERSDADASIVTVGGLSGDEITRERERERERGKKERGGVLCTLCF